MKKHIKSIFSFILILTLTTTLFVGCGGKKAGKSDTGEVVLGALYPLTGNNAKQGKEFIDAINLAVDIVNNKHDELGDFPFAKTEGIPNMNGAKLKVVKADTQGTPEVGATEADRLISSEKVDLLLGAYQSAVTKTASNTAERLGVPFVNSSSTSKALTERGFKWFFRTGPSDVTFVDDTIKFMNAYKDSVGIKTCVIVSEDTEFGMLFSSLFNDAAIKAGYQVLDKISYPANSANLSSEALRISKANPDVIVQSSYLSDAILFMNTYKDMNINPKMIIGQRGGFTAAEFFKTLGSTADYVLTTSVFSLDLTNNKPYLKIINDKFKEITGGVDLTSEYVRAMQSVFVVADALNRAGSKDKEAVRKALTETNLDSKWMLPPYAGVKFDEGGQNTLASGIITQYLDGVYQTIYPKEMAVKEAVIPVPAWKDRK